MSTYDGQPPGPGTLLDGRYRLDAVIARGGMSTVHLATDERLDRHVAVKLLDPTLAGDRAFVDRFTLEARSAARLSDPGIVQVFDQGVEAGTAFLVMELVPGGTLRELLDERGPMPPYAAAAVLRPLLGALREAHAAGLVHRDIKPENVLISTTGAVKLADFGLVRAVAESRATSSSVVMGTAAYLSPEQISGADTDARSDLYSLGVLAFEMLTGEPPFSGDNNIAVAYRRLDTDVPAPSDQSDTVAEDLDHLVLRATRRSREDRYADADEMLRDLDRAARIGRFPDYVVPAPRQSSWTRARANAARATPGGESEFDAADRESGEALRRGDGPTPTRVQTRADLAPAPPAGGPGTHAGPAEPARAPRAEVEAAPDRDIIRPRRQRGMLWLIVVLAAAIGLAVAGWWLGSGRFVEVPSVQGMSVGQATDAVNAVGLAAATRDAFSNDVPPSGLVGTDPAAGEKVPRGDTVAVLVSVGRPVVPEVGANRTVDAVSAALRENSLEPVRGGSEYSDSVPVGQVVSLQPGAGTTVDVGTRVAMITSSGPAPVAVPEVVGLAEDQARAALEGAGLAVSEVRRVYDDEVDGGLAVGTDPDAGTDVSRGDGVVLLVSNALTVPDIRDVPVDEATDVLEKAGFTVVLESPVTDRQVADGRVVRTEPPAGTRLDPSGAVLRIVPSDAVTVPVVLGSRASDARQRLQEAGLRATIDAGTSSGIVYGQTPLPGRVVARGSEVEIDALG
ncbi:Stk1 family PASTA domain-containing Ser/Thr kinase [Dietzia cinnamea]|uniref:non-specific serine/threonine protein kinase n=3 Tax=Dietzia TaxID=37914 RepID=A0AAW5Q695_9ACTN|nr:MULTISPECIES: Stk1 family PASTA domain-containing Ser/Thr kinase [Dietzia]MCT1639340.1 Stk1 family PASTA domain-containing Ser/Thr kinase [Dietzia cinnamea]MCT1863760.1 Stk1 family PASTA domain-containing Ser/Thr kinase [Dietzia cinnamea]MCT1885424.1 Stk1 family PASTA domain-containing Ser/Thr kinase [Dietzia cinnamea]MCT2029931.1 Stk1 family PASTA domain-containing Ser/Thr kinase [Dietzia cinnamea]MCT2032891.1 Stk1 family PASTA domain-containing Ser/Thr kinase [Dietzia cinnamea]